MIYKLNQAELDYCNNSVQNYDFHFNQIHRGDDGQSSFIGHCGEIAFARILKKNNIEFEYTGGESFYWDFVVDGIKIDVKAESSKYPHKETYKTFVKDSQSHYPSDMYVFVHVQNMGDEVVANVYGWSWKKDFYDKAMFVAPGDKLDDGYEVKHDGNYVIANQLNEIGELIVELRKQQFEV